MSPFIAALVACGYMASFIVFFGIVLPALRTNERKHPSSRRGQTQAPITTENPLASWQHRHPDGP
jgi:hypothetical protein